MRRGRQNRRGLQAAAPPSPVGCTPAATRDRACGTAVPGPGPGPGGQGRGTAGGDCAVVTLWTALQRMLCWRISLEDTKSVCAS